MNALRAGEMAILRQAMGFGHEASLLGQSPADDALRTMLGFPRARLDYFFFANDRT
jgi:hypothetical protein